MNLGWIKLHRKIKEHWLWPKGYYSKFEAWIDLILLANHSQGKVPIGSRLITVERGQLLTSQLQLAKRWGWNRKTVNTFLKLTKSDEILDFRSSSEADTGYTLVTIRNYNKYQSRESEALDTGADTGADTGGTVVGQWADTNKKDKNKKKEDKSGKPDSGPLSPIINRTILQLNELAGTSYRTTTPATVRVINARLAEGYTEEDLATVLEHKWDEWGDNEKMAEYFRPETLFAAKHFEGYLQAAKSKGDGKGHAPVIEELGGGMVKVDGVTMDRKTCELRYGRAS